MAATIPTRGSAVLLVRLVLCLFVLLPTAVQTLAIETLHFPDVHSQQSHRAPGLTTMSETGLATTTSVMPVAPFDVRNIAALPAHRPPARPVEPPEYPPR